MKDKYGNKIGICKCGCTKEKKPLYAKGLLQSCYWQSRRKIAESKEGKPGKIKTYRINKVSKSMEKKLAIYYPLRDNYLVKNPICEVIGCDNPSSNNHHRKGRIGKLLYDVEWFMACCSTCHPQKIHFTHVKWAIEMGYVLNSKK